MYTFIGLVLFLTGANVGFMPTGYFIGSEMAQYGWLIVPLGMVIGYFIVAAEPAVLVLNKQVEEMCIRDSDRQKSSCLLHPARHRPVGRMLRQSHCGGRRHQG